MLKEIGAEAFPVLIGTRGVVELFDDFPNLPFNHCIVVVRINEQMVFLDPTGEAVSYGDLPQADQGRNRRRVVVLPAESTTYVSPARPLPGGFLTVYIH